MSPDDIQAAVAEATYEHISGNSAAAIERLGRICTEAPGAAEAWHTLAEVHLSQRRLDEALAAAERAHALTPDDPLVVATLSRIWMERGDKARAEHFVAKARVQSWKEELRSPKPEDAGGLH